MGVAPLVVIRFRVGVFLVLLLVSPDERSPRAHLQVAILHLARSAARDGFVTCTGSCLQRTIIDAVGEFLF